LTPVSFEVTADAYRRFMGRCSEPLADEFVGLVDPSPGQRVLGVGCGPGALTAALTRRLGPEAFVAVDPSPSFAAFVRDRPPGVRVKRAGAERLPFRTVRSTPRWLGSWCRS
jgi:trans-aconitate methyltransferase